MHHFSSGGTQARLLHSVSRWWGCGLLLVLFLLLVGSSPRFWLDERQHAELSLHFANHPTWEAISTYEGPRKFMAKGPLFFLLGAAWGKTFGMTLPNLRVLSLLFGLLTLVASAMLVDEVVGKRRPGAPTALVVMPYFLFLSLTYHTDVAAVALSLFSAIGYSRNVDRLRPVALFGATISTISMLWMRIDTALLPAAVGVACLLDGPLPRQLSALPAWLSRLPLRLWIGLTLPALAVLPLLIAWGGILPPSPDGRDIPVTLQLLPSNLTFGLCVVGLYFFPFALRPMDRRGSTWAVAAAGILFFVAFPVSLHTGDGNRFLGLLRSAILTASLPHWLEGLVLAVLAASGALALKAILRVGRVGISARVLAAFVVLALLAQIVRGPIMYERYLLASNCALFVLALGVGLPSRWTFAWCAGLLVLAALQLARFL